MCSELPCPPTQVITYAVDLNAGLTQVLADNVNTYLYGNSRIAEYAGTTPSYFLGDALGSVRQLSNASKNVTLAKNYEPYGEVLSSVGGGASMYGYTGEQTDNTGLVFLRARYFAPTQGRFIQRDTWAGDYNRPQTLNGWAYTEGNPINYTDPTGFSITWLNPSVGIRPGGLYGKGELLAPITLKCRLSCMTSHNPPLWSFPIFDPTLGGNDVYFSVPNNDAGKRGGFSSSLVVPDYMEYSVFEFYDKYGNGCTNRLEIPIPTSFDWISINSVTAHSTAFGTRSALDYFAQGMAVTGQGISPAGASYLSNPRSYRSLDVIANQRGATGFDIPRTYDEGTHATMANYLEVTQWIYAAQKAQYEDSYRDILIVVQENIRVPGAFRVIVNTVTNSGYRYYLTMNLSGRLIEIPE